MPCFKLHLNAPKYYISDWTDQNYLASALTANEIAILNSPNELTEKEHYELYWSLESLWAIVWAIHLTQELPFNQPLSNELARLSPNLQLNEGGDKYQRVMHLRPIKSIFEMLDLYYRLHWWLQTVKKENQSTAKLHLEVIIARRKALEWILDSTTQWDNIDLSI